MLYVCIYAGSRDINAAREWWEPARVAPQPLHYAILLLSNFTTTGSRDINAAREWRKPALVAPHKRRHQVRPDAPVDLEIYLLY
jgi:hypothetical protein